MNYLKRQERNERIRELARQGWTYEMIAQELDLSYTTVWRALKNKTTNKRLVKL